MAIKDVKIIRLITGEELLAEVTIETGNSVTVKNAVRIAVIPNPQDRQNPTVGLAPFAQFADDKALVLKQQHVVYIATPIREFISQYNSMFGGIQLPSSPRLVIPE